MSAVVFHNNALNGGDVVGGGDERRVCHFLNHFQDCMWTFMPMQ
jgi:hypothetical protein